MRIYLIRHGDTQRAGNGVYGYSAPLSDLGLRQADLTARFMTGIGITKIVSSDAVRALQTAEPLVKSLKVDLDIVSELTEIDIGRPSDGITPPEQKFTPDGRFIMDCSHVGGESWDAFSGRVIKGLGVLAERFAEDDVVAVFTHGGVKNVALDHYSAREMSVAAHTNFENGSVSTFEPNGTGCIIHGVNDISHLS